MTLCPQLLGAPGDPPSLRVSSPVVAPIETTGIPIEATEISIESRASEVARRLFPDPPRVSCFRLILASSRRSSLGLRHGLEQIIPTSPTEARRRYPARSPGAIPAVRMERLRLSFPPAMCSMLNPPGERMQGGSLLASRSARPSLSSLGSSAHLFLFLWDERARAVRKRPCDDFVAPYPRDRPSATASSGLA
jgi:hypothetical protein